MGKGKTVTIVLLVLMVIGIGGYIVYDKFIKEEKKAECKTNLTEQMNKEFNYEETFNQTNRKNNISKSKDSFDKSIPWYGSLIGISLVSISIFVDGTLKTSVNCLVTCLNSLKSIC